MQKKSEESFIDSWLEEAKSKHPDSPILDAIVKCTVDQKLEVDTLVEELKSLAREKKKGGK